MAASLFTRYSKTSHLMINFVKLRFSNAIQSRRYRVVMTDDSSTVVCWHPEEKFPYEKSLPIPSKAVPASDSVFKIQSTKEFLSFLKPVKKSYVINQLSGMTHTCKHRWYPPGIKVAKRMAKKIERDRPYL